MDKFFNVYDKYGLIGDHTKNLGNFLSIGGHFIAYLSWIASVSHFVLDYVTYWNPWDSSKLVPILSQG